MATGICQTPYHESTSILAENAGILIIPHVQLVNTLADLV